MAEEYAFLKHKYILLVLETPSGCRRKASSPSTLSQGKEKKLPLHGLCPGAAEPVRQVEPALLPKAGQSGRTRGLPSPQDSPSVPFPSLKESPVGAAEPWAPAQRLSSASHLSASRTTQGEHGDLRESRSGQVTLTKCPGMSPLLPATPTLKGHRLTVRKTWYQELCTRAQVQVEAT